MSLPVIQALGDAAVVVSFGAELSDELNDRVMALAVSLAAEPVCRHVRDVVPALASLVLHVDPQHERVAEVIEQLQARAAGLFALERPPSGRPATQSGVEIPPATLHEIPVRYGGAEGPDLQEVAAFAGVDAREVIERHAAAIYRVYMLGFLPGFAYLGQVDRVIAAPRRSSPRQQVPAGSVGIAGLQTGVYPQDSPGGWQIIGRTRLEMFDVAGGVSRLQPGDRVRFIEV
jgi:KipI family sensor histidine kinase inhibitor